MGSARPPSFHFCYIADWRHLPMAYWVHVRDEADTTSACVPPAPTPHGRQGFPVLCVAFGKHELQFSSAPQLDEAIRVLAMKPLPSTRRLSLAREALAPPAPPPTNRTGRERARAIAGPNSHWLSRLPASLKTTKARERVVAGLRAVRALAVRDGAFVVPP